MRGRRIDRAAAHALDARAAHTSSGYQRRVEARDDADPGPSLTVADSPAPVLQERIAVTNPQAAAATNGAREPPVRSAVAAPHGSVDDEQVARSFEPDQWGAAFRSVGSAEECRGLRAA